MIRNLRLAAVIAGAWTVYAIFASSQIRINTYGMMVTPWRRALLTAFADAGPWALFTPIAFWIAGRCLVRRGRVWWTVPVLFVGGLALGYAHLAIYLRVMEWLGYVKGREAIASIVRGKLHSDVLVAWVLFGIRHAMDYYERYRSREVAASRLQAQLTQAQLEVLRAQLQPHFLFNTLHAISALMHRDVESADRMMTRLSDFLRLTLDSSGVQEVTLKREMEYLDKYLEIEQVRFGARLTVERRIDPRALDLFVPNLVLQPLVENAVRYAIASRAAGGKIEIAARVVDAVLSIEVRDDGPGAAEGFVEGVGISNTRARLEQLYGSRAKLELGNAESGGFRARVMLPSHTGSTEMELGRAEPGRAE